MITFLLQQLLVLVACGRVLSTTFTDTAPDLLVHLHDARGQAVARATLTVRDVAGQPITAAMTDATGTATVATLTVPEVRVAVTGRTADGRTLHQLGADAGGLALTLLPPPTVLDLRVEDDGTVIPDPATMIAPDPVLAPSAEPAPVFPTAALAASPVSTAAPIAAPPASPAEATTLRWWLGVIGIILFGVLLGSMLALFLRWRFA